MFSLSATAFLVFHWAHLGLARAKASMRSFLAPHDEEKPLP
jgi:hypothetical protein